MITNSTTGTNVHEIADSIFRINTPVEIPGAGAFCFNQYLVRDEHPLLFHTGPRGMFPLVREAIEKIVPVASLRYLSWSHHEADESGAMNDFLEAAPRATVACGSIAAMTSVSDLAIRPPRALADGEELGLGQHRVRWIDAPHVPHGWDCGFLFESTTRTLLCGDLFTQPGRAEVPLTEADVLQSSEAFRGVMDYYAHTPQTSSILAKLAATAPRVLACMHGSAWAGDGAALLGALARSLATARKVQRARSLRR